MKATATTVHRLVQGSKVFLIPAFQRRYTWRKEQWTQLWNDVVSEYHVEHPSDPESLHGHFLGSVVLHPALGPASTLMRHQVIDGQQRLTTILLLLAALRDVRSERESSWDPASIDAQYLTNPWDKDYPNRLVPTKLDRDAYVETVVKGRPTGDVGMAYNFFRSEIERAVETDGLELERIQETILLNLLVVEITTKTGDPVNSIFNTLNSKGMELSPADLVRNELLHHIGSEDEGERAHEKYWIPMETALVNHRAKSPDREFVTFLWSREVALDPKVSRDDLFPKFERRLRAELDAAGRADSKSHVLNLLVEMYNDFELFRLIRKPDSDLDLDVDPELLHAIIMLREWRAEPTTPLALWLVKHAMGGRFSQQDAAKAIEVLLSYLVKRILHGIPTNQLNRLLTPLAYELSRDEDDPRPIHLRLQSLLSRASYYWPSDDQVRTTVVSNPIYASARRYVKFLLSAAEQQAPGKESVDFSRAQIEHIMPQSLSDDWRMYLADRGVELERAEALTHTLGNLTLTENNQRMGNALFEVKKSQFFRDSSFWINRRLAELEDLTPAVIEQRSLELAEFILKAFPHKPLIEVSPEEASGASPGARLEAVLQVLPVGRWVAEEDLVSLLGLRQAELRALVNRLDPTLARLIREPGTAGIPDWFSDELRGDVIAQDFAQGKWEEGVTSSELAALVADAEDEGSDDADLEEA